MLLRREPTPPLSMETIAVLHRAEFNPSYAYGWSLQHNGDDVLIWHNGSAGTFYAHLQIDPTSSTVVAVVANAGMSSQATVDRIADSIRRFVTR